MSMMQMWRSENRIVFFNHVCPRGLNIGFQAWWQYLYPLNHLVLPQYNSFCSCRSFFSVFKFVCFESESVDVGPYCVGTPV